MPLSHRTLPSPVGELRLVANDRALVAVLWPVEREGRVRLGEMSEARQHPVLDETARQLNEYFAGSRRQFDLPLEPLGTEFQRAVWNALTRIPFGETRSYGQLAKELGDANASRAVGAANGRNPISIVVPCHRVIGANGSLTGFAGGTEAKRFLLELERGPGLF